MELLPGSVKRDFKPPVSPSGVVIMDGNRTVRGYLLYHLGADYGYPFVFDSNPSANQLLMDWLLVTNKQHLKWKNGTYMCAQGGKEPESPCEFEYCLCNRTTVTAVLSETISSRGQLPLYGHHWMQKTSFTGAESKLEKLPSDAVQDTAKDWKMTWTSNHPSFQRLTGGGKNFFPAVEQCEKRSGFNWAKLPLEVYETLVTHLDGVSLMNLCHASSLTEKLILEPFAIKSYEKRQLHWHEFCIENLDREYMCEIVASLMNFDIPTEEKLEPNDRIVCLISWEDVFKAYQSFWHVVANADIRIRRLNELENKLKSQILLMRDDKTTFKTTQFGDVCLLRAGGGGLLFNIMLPCISDEKSKYPVINMMVVEEMGMAGCVKFSSICTGSNVIFGLKIMYFPRIRRSSKLLYMDRVLVSVCNKCITVSSLFCDIISRRRFVWNEEEKGTAHNECPIFETYKNVIVLWHDPKSIKFFVIASTRNDEGFALHNIYQLQFGGMVDVWKHIVQYRSYYISDVREYKGNTEVLSEFNKNLVMGESGYIYSPQEPTFYGLTLISPIYGVESFKPKLGESLDTFNTTVESLEPQYYSNNAKWHIAGMREPTCSGKGHGMYVFCSNTTIAASWDCVTWVFGPLKFPMAEKTGSSTLVTHVEVMNHNNGLLLIVNEDILLLDVIVKDRNYWDWDDTVPAEPELEVKLLRAFQTGIAAMYREITHCELNFDEGQPFLLLVSERKSQKKDIFGAIHNKRDELSFVVKRIDFVI